MPWSKQLGQAKSSASFLIVEDDELFGTCLARTVGRYGSVNVARTLREANSAIGQRQFSALLVDVRLPDGSGVDVIAADRALHRPNTPALVFSGGCESRDVNRACSFHVRYAEKPLPLSLVVNFLQESTAMPDDAFRSEAVSVGSRINGLVHGLAVQHKLTPSEEGIVLASMQGLAPKEYAHLRGIKMTTYKTEARSALKKMGAWSVGSIRDRILKVLAAHEAIPASRCSK